MPTRTDVDRLATLQRLAILDTAPENVYDEFARSLAGLLDVPIAMVNILDADRDWFKSCIGLPIKESPAVASFCDAFFSTSADLIVVDDTTADPRFASSPFVQGPPFIRFYAGARLRVEGRTMATLCAYDIRSKILSPSQVSDMLALAGAAIVALKGRMSHRPAPAS